MNKVLYSNADPTDLEAVQLLLKESKLPYADISPHLPSFLLAKHHNTLIGCIGLQNGENHGLLRSFAVHSSYQGHGVGKALLLALFASCKQKSLHKLYLLTTTAENYFSNFGFEKIQRSEVPSEIMETEEFKHLCPDSAVCMVKIL